MKNVIVLTVVFCLCSLATQAQYFLTPINNIPYGKECKVVTKDGNKMEGKITGALYIKGMLRSFTVKDTAGEKHKYKADQISNMEMKIGALGRTEAAMNTANAAKKSKDGAVAEVINREWMTMEQASLPKKKKKYRLLQLLNPGFDSQIKVYQDPNAKKTMGVGIAGMNVIGREAKSYLVVKNGEKAILVKKKKYKKQFAQLFGDSPEVMKLKEEGKLKFKEFANHAYLYDQSQKATASN
ncbi:MAG: hypothetical protein AAFP82_03015 [Bacteroidota bacterium]